MSFSEVDEMLDAEREAQSSNSSSGGSDEEYETYARVGLVPRAAVSGRIVDIGFTGDVRDEQNIRGADNYRDNGDFIFTLEDPQVELGALWEARGRQNAEDGFMANVTDYSGFYSDLEDDTRVPANDFRVVDPDGDNVSELVQQVDGDYDQVGIEYGSNGTEFPGSDVATIGEDDEPAPIDEETIEIFIGSQAGRIMAQALDVSQGRSAFVTDDGDKQAGLVEFPSTWSTEDWDPDEGYPRSAVYPQLHPELDGERITLYLRYGDEYQGNRKYLGHVFLDDGESVADCTELTGAGTDDVFEPRLDLRDPTDIWLEYHEPESGWGSGSSSSDGGGMDFSELDESDGGGSGGLDLESQPSDVQTFVDEAKSLAEAKGVDEIEGAFDNDFETVVTNAKDHGDITADVSADSLETLINGEL